MKLAPKLRDDGFSFEETRYPIAFNQSADGCGAIGYPEDKH